MSGQYPPPPGDSPQPPGNQGSYGGPAPYGGAPPGGPGQPNYPRFPSGGSEPLGQGGSPSAKGFFGALFDFKFEHFITPIIVKIVYVIALVALVLTWLLFTVSSLAQSAGLGLVVLILGAIAVILYLAFIRMTLEFYLAIVRMSQDIHHRPLR